MEGPTPSHPFARLSDRSQRLLFTILLLGVLALSTFLTVLGSPLQTEQAPSGIVSFELAGSGAAAARILASWPEGERNLRDLARLHLGVDFVYLVLYPALLSLACARVALRLRARPAARIGSVLAWLLPLAGLLDAAENVALLRMLGDGPSDAMAQLAWACAVPKFALVLAALAYSVGGWLWSRFGAAAAR
jgi:hypothetical protein